MAKVCYFTGRKTVSGNNRSHAMNQTKRTVKPNLQKVTILVDGKPKSAVFLPACFLTLCSRCSSRLWKINHSYGSNARLLVWT